MSSPHSSEGTSHGFSDMDEEVAGPSGYKNNGQNDPPAGKANGGGDVPPMESEVLGYGSKPRVSSVTLKMDGSNFTVWKVLIPAILDSEPYALAVTKGTLLPPAPGDTGANAIRQQQKYDAGNRAARCILFSSLQQSLAVSLFSDNSETVHAPEMWREILGKFTNSNGGLKQLAISKLMTFKYNEKKTAGENLFRYNPITNYIASLGVKIPDDMKIKVLLEFHSK